MADVNADINQNRAVRITQQRVEEFAQQFGEAHRNDVNADINQNRAVRIAQRRVEGFAQQFGEAHCNLARHGAFPLVLTPDLLYQIWANFVPEAPWTAVAHVLLSRLCRQVGYEMYEMDIADRNLLLRELKEQSGQARFDELGKFLLDYVAQRLTDDDPDTRDLREAQEWTALAYTKPDKAARKLAQALSQKVQQEDMGEVMRLASLVKTLAEPLLEAEFEHLLNYAVSNLRELGDRLNAIESTVKLKQLPPPYILFGTELDKKSSSEQFLLSMYNSVQASIFVVDVLEDGDFRYVALNPTHERWIGISSEELRGKKPEDILSPVDAAKVRQHYTDCVRFGKTISYEQCLQFQEIPTWWSTTLTPLRDANSRIYRLIGTSSNINPTKQTEPSRQFQYEQQIQEEESNLRELDDRLNAIESTVKLKQLTPPHILFGTELDKHSTSEQFLLSMYDSVQASIFVVDVLEDGDFRYVAINPTYERWIGIRSDDLRGKKPEDILSPIDAARVRQHYADCVLFGTTISYEQCLQFQGISTWWITTLTPLRDANSRIYRLIGTSTARRK